MRFLCKENTDVHQSVLLNYIQLGESDKIIFPTHFMLLTVVDTVYMYTGKLKLNYVLLIVLVRHSLKVASMLLPLK